MHLSNERGGRVKTERHMAEVSGSSSSEDSVAPVGDLLSTIEEAIIPRLMLAHTNESNAQKVRARGVPTPGEVAEFARLAACDELATVLAYVEEVTNDGLDLASVLLHLVAPAARLLGDQWKADLRSFTEVTTGIGTLQQVVHVLGPAFASALPERGQIVLTAAPGEQHTLGLSVLAEFLRRAGWAVHLMPSATSADLLYLVSNDFIEAIGFTVSTPTALAQVGPLITSLHKASKNPDLTVMLGGSLDLTGFLEKTDVDAVVCSGDPTEVVRWLETRVPAGQARTLRLHG